MYASSKRSIILLAPADGAVRMIFFAALSLHAFDALNEMENY